MPFGTITSQTVSYEPRQPGIYSKSGLSFDMPANEYRIKGAGRSSKSNQIVTATVTRYLQKDVAVGTAMERRNCVATLSLQLPAGGGFTATELNSLVEDISSFITDATVSRLLQGES